MVGRGRTPSPHELKKMNTDLQRYARICAIIKADPKSDILTLESELNEHFEMDKFRILLPKALHNQATRRFHKPTQERQFTIGITASKLLDHFWMPRPYPIITEYISNCLDCQLKRNQLSTISNHK